MPDAALFQRRFAQAMTAQAPSGAAPAFTVYRNTWLKGLVDALDANYPIVAMILGAELFRTVAVEFAREHPSETPVLALYGNSFAEFLGGHSIASELPYLRDVAALERLWTESFFAPDAPILDLSRYAALTPAEIVGLRAKLHPATRLGRSETPAVTIWQAHRAGGGFEEIEPEWEPEFALVTRNGMKVSVTRIDKPAHRLLVEIERANTLGSAIDETAQAHPNSNLAGALTTILSSGALAVH